MSFVRTSDKYSEKMADNVEKAFFDEELLITMRFSNLHPDEQYSNTMCFGNTRYWLNTGINQWKRMVDILEKWKDKQAGKPVPEDTLPPNDKRLLGQNYIPSQVDDVLTAWKGDQAKGIRGYNLNEPPYSKNNWTWILNHGILYNRALMYVADFFEPVHRGHLNGRYANENRSFNAMVDLGMAERNRGMEIERREPDGQKKGHFWAKKKEGSQ